MKLKTIGSFIMVIFLAYNNWNIVVPVKADEEDSTEYYIETSTTCSDFSSESEVTLTGIDLNIASDCESTDKFDYNKVGNYIAYTAKDDYGFKLVKEDNNVLWEARNKNNYSVKVEVDLIDNDSKAVIIHLRRNKTYVFMKKSKNDPWIKIDKANLNVAELSIDCTHETFCFKTIVIGNYVTFKAKPGFVFKTVMESIGRIKVQIWKSIDQSDYSHKVEVFSIDDHSKVINIHLSEKKKKMFMRSSLNDPWSEIITSELNPVPVYIDHPQETFYYKTSSVDNLLTFKAKPGFGFNRVVEYIEGRKLIIWKTSNKRHYSDNIDVDLIDNDSKAVIIHSPRNKTRVFTKSSKNDSWEELDTSEPNAVPVCIDNSKETFNYKCSLADNCITFTTKPRSFFNCVYEYFDNNKLEIWKTDKHSEYSHKIEVYSIDKDSKVINIHLPENMNMLFMRSPRSKVWIEINTSFLNPVPVYIDHTQETFCFNSNLVDNILTFKSKTGFAFNSVVEYLNDKNIEIWKTSNKRFYSHKIEVDLIDNYSKAITIHFPENKSSVFIKYGTKYPWKKIDLSGVDPMSLNIQYPYHSYFFKNVVVNDVITFTAKKGFLFNNVREVETDIWSTSNEYSYAFKVEYAKRVTKQFDLTIYLQNGKKKLFIKENDSDPWKELNITKVHPESINIDFEHNSYVFNNDLQGNFRTFTAKTGFAFNSVVEYLGDKKIDIWKTDNKSEYSKKIEVDLINFTSRAVTVYFEDDKSIIFMKTAENDSWTELDISQVNPMSMNIQYPYDTYFLSNKYENNVTSFEAKHGFIFNDVRDVETKIWSATNAYEYAIKVEYAKRPSKQFDLTIFLHNGIKKMFIKENDSESWKEIDISEVISKDICIDNAQSGYLLTSHLQGNLSSFTDKTLYPGHQAHQVQLSAQPGQGPVPESEDILYSDILLVTFDSDINKSVKLDPNLYKAYDYQNIIEYSLSQHAKCKAIKHASKLVWKHNHEKYGDSYPETIIHNKNTQKIYIHFKDFEIFFQRDLQGSWNASKFEISLFAQDTSDKRFKKELDISQYLLTKVEEKYHFLINQEVLCSEIHLDDKIIWKSGEFQLQNPFLVTFHEKLNEIAVGDHQKLLFYYKLNDSWPFYRTKYINGNRRPSMCKTPRDRRIPCTSSSREGSED